MAANEQQQSRLKELITKGREQGFLTYAEVNDHLPQNIADPDQVEDIIGRVKVYIANNVIGETCSVTSSKKIN